MYSETNSGLAALQKQKDASHAPFQNNWHVIRRLNDNWYLLARQLNGETIYTPLYHMCIRFFKLHHRTESEKFNILYTSPAEITNTSDKLKHYRHVKSLKQQDIANLLGINRSTYIRYEENPENIPTDMLSKIASVLDIDPKELLTDDYCRFQFDNQGEQLKAIRKKAGMTQIKFADTIGVHSCTIKRWEKNIAKINRETYARIKEIFEN